MHKFIISFILFLALGSNSLYSQDWNKILTYDTDASYLMADKQFSKAAETFIKAAKLIPESANLKFKIGYCYLNTDDKKSEAIPYLMEAIQKISKNYDNNAFKELNAPIESLYLLAEALRINRQYSEAIEIYKKYKENLKPTDKLISLVDLNIQSCTNAATLMTDSLIVKSTNLGNLINNETPNVNAVISGDGKTMAFTNITKTGNDVFVSRMMEKSWGLPIRITSQLGDKYLLTSFLSYDGKDLYLTSDDPVDCDLYVTTTEKNKWIKPLKFKKPINSKSNENHICLSQDGNTMYFTSDRKGGLGGYDIYKTVVNDKGVWSEPVNLGPEINTPFNESTPFLSPDEKYLFFSSEGHPGVGGFDIFYVNLDGAPTVTNIGYPVNNSDNNVFYFPLNGWKTGIISVYSKKGLGQRDINRLDISKYINLTGSIVADANTSSAPFKIRVFDTNNNDTIAKLESTSSFSYKVGIGNYKVFVNNSNYFPFQQDVTIPEDYTSKDFSIEAKLQPIPVVTPILVAEELPKEVKKDSAIVETPKVLLAENINTTTEKPKDKKREIKKTENTSPSVTIENSNDSNSAGKITTYAVQLMALDSDVGASYFKNIENIEITTTPEGIYRYSVGTTESMGEAMATLKKVKDLGYEKAFVRIDYQEASYTIQLMALRKPVELSFFKEIQDVIELKGSDGYYRYSVGSFANPTDAKSSLNSVHESGYKEAFIKKVGVK